MDSFINVIVTFVLLTVIYKYFENRSYGVVLQKSDVDDNEYLVRNLPDRQKAADTLANISKRLLRLVNFIKRNSANIDTMYNKYVKSQFEKTISSPTDKNDSNYQKLVRDKKNKLIGDLNRLVQNFNPNKISETTPDAKYTSYSVNKGEKIVFCLRSKDEKQKLVDLNIMMFVALHELAHTMTKSVGHTPEFWNNFRILLRNARKLGIYKRVNYNEKPVEYCGTKITDDPENFY